MSEKVTKEVPKVKRRFIITLDGIAPVKLELETWAFDEHEALVQLNNPSLVKLRQPPQVDLPRVKRSKVSIKDALTSFIKLVKNF